MATSMKRARRKPMEMGKLIDALERIFSAKRP